MNMEECKSRLDPRCNPQLSYSRDWAILYEFLKNIHKGRILDKCTALFLKNPYLTSFKGWRQNGRQSEGTDSAKAHASCLSNLCQGNKNNCILIAATSHSTIFLKKCSHVKEA